MAKLRIGIVGMRHESMIRSPFLTGASAFTVSRGRDIVDGELWSLRGAVERFREEGVDMVPLVFGRAWPGGAIERGAYEAIKAECVEAVRRNGPYDGLLVSNHGAMEVDGLGRHGDTDFICAIRAAAGPDVPISTPFDMHGQLTPELLDALTVFSVLRTAPHRDDRETSMRAADLLLRVIRREITPAKAMVRLPMYIPGEKSMTLYSPAQELFESLGAYDAQPGLLEANIFIGFGWNDLPWTGMQATVIADGDAALARRTAAKLAGEIWARRHDFQLSMETASIRDGLRRAAQLTERPVYLTDSGDNTSAGAAGDLTFVLQEALATPDLKDAAVVGIRAPEIVRQCLAAGVGAEVELELGREHRSAPVQVRRARGVVETCAAEAQSASLRDVNYPVDENASAWVAVRFGEVLATFHADRVGIGAPGQLRAFGIDPLSHRTYVVKLGYLLPDLADIAAHHILLISDGAANLDFSSFAWTQIARPAFPMDPDMTWAAAQP